MLVNNDPLFASDEELPTAMYFIVADRDRRICSYTWRIGWSGTSFYLKPLHAPLSALKVSLHGPAPRPEMRPGFKIGIEEGAAPSAEAAGGVYAGSVAERPQ